MSGGDDLLGSISRSLQNTIKNKLKNKNKSKDPVEVLAYCLWNAQDLFTADDTKQQDLEISFGAKLGEAYRSGIRKEHFEHLCLQMNKEKEATSSHSQYSDYLFKSPDGTAASFIISYDDKEKKCLNAFSKSRKKTADLQQTIVPYDGQFSASLKTEYEAPNVLPDDWISKLEKVKWSFQFKLWTLELTQVLTLGRRTTAHQVVPGFELEVRFKDEVLQRIREKKKEKLHEISVMFWDFMRRAMSRLHTTGDAHRFSELKMDKVNAIEEIDLLKKTVLEYILPVGQDTESEELRGTFPGSQPVHLSRRHFKTIQDNPYSVSPKLDGIRYILLLMPKYGVYLIDRKFRIHFIHGFDYLLDILAENGPTILDGEMVRNMETDKIAYSVIDLLAQNGNRTTELTLSERLKMIWLNVVIPFRKGIETGKIPTNHPFSIIGQIFLTPAKLKNIASQIKMEDGQRCFVDSKRNFKIDGIVFTPDSPYQAGKVEHLYKWKYIDALSLDLKIGYRNNNTTLIFTCEGSGGASIEYGLTMSQGDRAKLRYDMLRQRDPNNIIVEFCYDNWAGIWTYQRIRADRNRPNSAQEVFEILEVIAEGIPLEELLYRIPYPSQEDDWREKITESICSITETSPPSTAPKGRTTPLSDSNRL